MCFQILDENIERREALLPVYEFILAILHLPYDNGLQAIGFLAVLIDVVQKRPHLQRLPSVASLIAGYNKLSVYLPDELVF